MRYRQRGLGSVLGGRWRLCGFKWRKGSSLKSSVRKQWWHLFLWLIGGTGVGPPSRVSPFMYNIHPVEGTLSKRFRDIYLEKERTGKREEVHSKIWKFLMRQSESWCGLECHTIKPTFWLEAHPPHPKCLDSGHYNYSLGGHFRGPSVVGGSHRNQVDPRLRSKVRTSTRREWWPWSQNGVYWRLTRL